jgi:hypothetical protein
MLCFVSSTSADAVFEIVFKWVNIRVFRFQKSVLGITKNRSVNMEGCETRERRRHMALECNTAPVEMEDTACNDGAIDKSWNEVLSCGMNL